MLNGVITDHRGLEPDWLLTNRTDAAWDWPKLDLKKEEIDGLRPRCVLSVDVLFAAETAGH